jgi:sporulation protein YlmC with PRC-barrel domain
MDHPRPDLKYVNAKDLDESAMKFDGMEVEDLNGEKLGKVEGFIIDVVEGRPRHIAVSAGWFLHKHFLLPIGHAVLSGDGTKLIADVTKERVNRFPGFHKEHFVQLTAEELKQLDETLAAACAAGDAEAGDFDSHYRTPDWWEITFYRVPASRSRM